MYHYVISNKFNSVYTETDSQKNAYL